MLVLIALLLAKVSPGIGDALAAEPHWTPTKTPRTLRATTTPVLLEPVIPVSTPVPLPSPVPTPAPVAEPLPPYLQDVVERYGMDAGRRFVVVDPNLQQMTVWEPGHAVRRMPVSTGDEQRGYRTPAWYGLVGRYWGTFQAFGVYADDGWYLYEDAGAILVHGAPYKLENGVKVYEELDALGNYPASRGCIRLRPEDARWFTDWRPEGVPLVVLPRVYAPPAAG